MTPDEIRNFVKNKIIEENLNYSEVSKMLGKGVAYIHQYINKGSPVRLPEQVRKKLAKILHVSEQELSDIPVNAQAEIDEEFLVRIINRVEFFAENNPLHYSPAYKAQLIKTIYQEFSSILDNIEDKEIDNIIKISDYYEAKKKAN